MPFFQNEITQYQDFQYDYGYQCYIFRRQYLVENDIWFPLYSRYQDPPFFVRAMYTAKEFCFIDEPVYCYRRISTQTKHSMEKTLDMLSGVVDNLTFSKEKDLVKLHYLSACRLNTEGSFMATSNLFQGNKKENYLLYKLIMANSMVDVDWLKKSGYHIKEPFVIDSLQYIYDMAKKYEAVRNSKLIRALKRIIRS